MKPFNLEEALRGKPVQLRSWEKVYAVADIGKFGAKSDYPLRGYKVDYGASEQLAWTKHGKFTPNKVHSDSDIIGMWEENPLPSGEVLEKAYNEDLLVCSKEQNINQARVVGKHKNGNYVIDAEGVTNLTLANKDQGWELYAPEPKVTVELPKTISPEEDDEYYAIYLNAIGKLDVRKRYANNLERPEIEQGNCFRTKNSAQDWIDAMKNSLGE